MLIVDLCFLSSKQTVPKNPKACKRWTVNSIPLILHFYHLQKVAFFPELQDWFWKAQMWGCVQSVLACVECWIFNSPSCLWQSLPLRIIIQLHLPDQCWFPSSDFWAVYFYFGVIANWCIYKWYLRFCSWFGDLAWCTHCVVDTDILWIQAEIK